MIHAKSFKDLCLVSMHSAQFDADFHTKQLKNALAKVTLNTKDDQFTLTVDVHCVQVMLKARISEK